MKSTAHPARAAIPLVDRLAAGLCALAVLALVAPHIAGFTTDSDAYLDVAGNLLAGYGLVQRVVDFWRPALPDPLGMWPPLYPALIALVAACGVPLEAAARLVSGAGFAVFAVAFHDLAARALGRGGGLLVTVLALATTGVYVAGAHAWSESTYMALVALALTLLMGQPAESRIGPKRAVAAGAALGLAALTRYAGMPLLALAAPYALAARGFRGVRGRFLLAATVLPAIWIVRSLWLFGRPFGPELPASTIGLPERAIQLAQALRWELVPAPLSHLAPAGPLIALLIGAGVLLALADRAVGRPVAVVAIVQLGVVWAATSLTAINAPAGRYLAPALPFLLLAGMSGLAGRSSPAGSRRRSLVLGFAAALALAAAIGVMDRSSARPTRASEWTARQGDRALLARLVPPGASPVLTDSGHLLRLATGRSAIQVPPAGWRPRGYGEADDVRWARAGVDTAVFRAMSHPPAGRWSSAGAAGEFRMWVRAVGVR